MQDLRHFRHQESEASGGGADLPRLAYAHARAWIRTTKTTSTSTFPAHRSCASRKNWRAAPAKRRTRIPNTALFRIEVIKVPVAAPQDAKIVSSPRVFIDPRTGAMNGLNNGGSHDKDEEQAAPTPTSATTSPFIRRSGWPRAPAPATEFCWTSRTPFIRSAWMR